MKKLVNCCLWAQTVIRGLDRSLVKYNTHRRCCAVCNQHISSRLFFVALTAFLFILATTPEHGGSHSPCWEMEGTDREQGRRMQLKECEERGQGGRLRGGGLECVATLRITHTERERKRKIDRRDSQWILQVFNWLLWCFPRGESWEETWRKGGNKTFSSL